ncbi:hypothetical protein VTN77DRAFT_9216 [Rasamsonia byssochlamydoides]|uniref:uncharacterized protein n=1 Tax=Rasamsonia byssochlamydoides TaxID=89139 RepID=UPI00374424B3
MSADSPGEKKVSAWLRPKKSRQKLRKRGPASLTSASSTSLVSRHGHAGYDDDAPPVPLAPLQAHRLKYREAAARLDTQLGENRDYTAMLHALGLQEPFDSNQSAQPEEAEQRPPGEPAIASLSRDLWQKVADYLNPKDAASLALASKTLYRRLGWRPFAALNRPENYEYKLEFLVLLDRHLPHHLLCIPCAKYHRRTQEGHEQLQPAHVLNPLFNCPNARNMLRSPPRHRISHGRTLPFTFVQLVMRAHRFSERYGISPESLARRWRHEGWSFSTRYHIHNGRLLMRVVSSTFAAPGLSPSAQRMLLFSREDYWPYFSVCAHWRDGELMSVCKCALSHIPKPRATAGYQRIEARVKDALAGRSYDPNAVASLCGHCQPMRRCPECPTEYLVEIKLTEDRADPKSIHFRHAIVVTRWSDLGDGTTPFSSREWAACNGASKTPYDSFAEIGKRAISGIFESAFTHDTIPGRRIMSLNPTGKKGGEEKDDWY